MAMTFKSSPTTVAPGHRPLWYVVDSTNKAETNYKYIVDLVINSSIVATFKTRPYAANNNYGVVDIANAVRQYFVPSYFNPSGVVVCGAVTGHKVGYQVVLSESYTSGSSTVTNSNQASGTASTAYNSFISLQDLPYKSVSGNYLNNFVTNRPTTIRVGSSDSLFFNIFADSSSYTSMEVQRFDNTGASLGTSTYTVSGDVMVNLSPSIVGATGTTSYYTAKLKRAGSQVGSTLTFNLSECEKYTQRNIHFMNSAGGFDSIPFRLVSVKKRESEKKNFQQANTAMDSSGNISYYNSNRVFNEGRIKWASEYKDKITLNSGLMTPDEYVWLAELIDSPQIFIEETINGSTYYMPVVITANNFEFKDRQVDKQNSLELEFEYSVSQNSIYR